MAVAEGFLASVLLFLPVALLFRAAAHEKPASDSEFAAGSFSYTKLPGEICFSAQPHPAVRVLTVVGESGMTLGFGLFERTLTEWGFDAFRGELSDGRMSEQIVTILVFMQRAGASSVILLHNREYCCNSEGTPC